MTAKTCNDAQLGASVMGLCRPSPALARHRLRRPKAAAPLGKRRPLVWSCSLLSPLCCSDGYSMKTLTACRYVNSAPVVRKNSIRAKVPRNIGVPAQVWSPVRASINDELMSFHRSRRLGRSPPLRAELPGVKRWTQAELSPAQL